jgi:hypothetical protein
MLWKSREYPSLIGYVWICTWINCWICGYVWICTWINCWICLDIQIDTQIHIQHTYPWKISVTSVYVLLSQDKSGYVSIPGQIHRVQVPRCGSKAWKPQCKLHCSMDSVSESGSDDKVILTVLSTMMLNLQLTRTNIPTGFRFLNGISN